MSNEIKEQYSFTGIFPFCKTRHMNTPQYGPYIQILLLIAFIIPAIFFILTQQRILKLIRPVNRHMTPNQVWLQLVPLFGLIWQFFIIIKVSNSIRDELNAPVGDSLFIEGSFRSARPTYRAGILYATFFCLSCLPLPLLKGVFALATLSAWIFYWGQLSRYKKQLKERTL